MSRTRHAHYLRYERKRAGLTQGDIATLLGVRAVTKISRYERGRHLPPLKTALAYEVLLGQPVAKLFAGTYEALRDEIAMRAERRLGLLRLQRETPRVTRRKRSVETLANRPCAN